MTDLAALVVRMQADNSAYVKALDQATAKLDKFHKNQTSLLDQMGEKFRGLAGDIVAGFAVDKILEFSIGAIEAEASLAKLSQMAGVSVETLSGLGFAAAAVGISQDEMAMSMKKLNVAISDAAGDTASKAGIAFGLLGIKVKDASGNLKDAGQITYEMADAFKGAADGPNKVAIAVALMGKAGQQMIPQLNQGADGLRAMQKAAEDSGAALSKDAAEAAEAFSVKLNVLTKELHDGLGNMIAAQLIPVLTHMIEAFGSAAERGQVLQQMATGIVAVFKIVASVGLEVGREFETMGSAIGGAAAAVVAAAHGEFAQAAAILKDQTADAHAINEKYAKLQSALYHDVTEAEIKEAKRAADETEAIEKKKLGSLAEAQAASASDKKIEQFAQGIEDQVHSFDMGEAAMVRYKLTLGSMSEDYAKATSAGKAFAAQAIAAANALQFKKDTKTSDTLVQGMIAQIAALDASDSAAMRYKLSTGDLGKALDRMGLAGTNARVALMALSGVLTDEKDKKAVQALNDEIDKTRGKLADAGVAAFDLQNKSLQQNLTDRGDAPGLAALATRRAQIDALDQFAQQEAHAAQIEHDLGEQEALIQAARTAGSLTDLEMAKQLNTARLAEISSLQGVHAAEQKIATDSGIPELIEKTKEFGTQIIVLKSQTELLEKSVRDNLEQSFANNFSDLITGAKSFRDAMKGFFKDIEKMMADMVAKDFAQHMFGTGGPAGGVAGGIASLFGGGGGGGGSGAGGILSSIMGLFGGGKYGNSNAVIPGVSQNGGMGGGIGSIVGSLDGFATGGTIPAGKMGIVGENQPELAYAGSQDLHIQPISKNAGVHQTLNFHITAPGGTISRQSQTQTAAEVGRQVSIASRRNN